MSGSKSSFEGIKVDTAEVRGVAGDRAHQGRECDSLGAGSDAASAERLFRFIVELEPSRVPEPSVIALMALGLVALAWATTAPARRVAVSVRKG